MTIWLKVEDFAVRDSLDLEKIEVDQLWQPEAPAPPLKHLRAGITRGSTPSGGGGTGSSSGGGVTALRVVDLAVPAIC